MSGIPVFLVFTGIGTLMKRYGYSRPTLALGFILGGLFEHYLWLGLHKSGLLFFTRGPALIIIAIIIALYVFHPLRSAIKSRLGRGVSG